MRNFLLMIAVVMGQSVLAAEKKPLTNEESAKVIEAAIREELKKPTGELGKADLEQVKNLEIHNNQISDVSALKELSQLTVLNLNGNLIRDVSPLKKLAQLKVLYLSSNLIRDVSPLKKLKKLTELYLRDNQISDVSALGELMQLTELGLGSNQIRDASPLKELNQLTVLYLNGNQIRDVNPLKELNQLTVLGLHDAPNLTKTQIIELQKALPKCEIGHKLNTRVVVTKNYNGARADLIKLLMTSNRKAAWVLGEKAPNKIETYKWWTLANTISVTTGQGQYRPRESARLKATITSAADQQNFTIWHHKVLATYKTGKGLQSWLNELQQKNLFPR